MANQDNSQLKDKHVAILMTDGVEQVEYTDPRSFLEEHGAQWSDEEVIVDGRLITSRKPDDIPAFNKVLQQQLLAG